MIIQTERGEGGKTGFDLYLLLCSQTQMSVLKLCTCPYLWHLSSTQTHTFAHSWQLCVMLCQYHSESLSNVSGWLLSDVRLICNSSPFCSDKRVGVRSFMERGSDRDEEGRQGMVPHGLLSVYWQRLRLRKQFRCFWQVFRSTCINLMCRIKSISTFSSLN